jgi:putative endonuclease
MDSYSECRKTDRQLLGQRAEQQAAEFLSAQGATILLRNFRRRVGELDLVAKLNNTLLLVEVRTRNSRRYGGAAASVDSYKQRRLIRTTQLLLQQHRSLAALPLRFDVIVVTDAASSQPQIEWLKHAFSA